MVSQEYRSDTPRRGLASVKAVDGATQPARTWGLGAELLGT